MKAGSGRGGRVLVLGVGSHAFILPLVLPIAPIMSRAARRASVVADFGVRRLGRAGCEPKAHGGGGRVVWDSD
jgi:hypothetical protein